MEKFKEIWSSSIINRLLIIVVIPWIILAIIFGLTDLEISKAIVDPNSGWGNFGAEWGEAPGYGIIAIAIAVAIGSQDDDLKKQRIACYVLMIIGTIVLIIGIAGRSTSVIAFGGGVLIPLVLFYILTRDRDWKDFQTISYCVLFLAILNPLLFVQVTKIMCGRVRFRNLNPGYSNFTPWFAPPGPLSGIQGNASFPSGHTAMGVMFFPLLLVVADREWKDPVKIVTWILVIGWGIFVGASRVVVGAHYASDVLFSTAMAAIITIWLYKRYYLNK